MDELRVRALLTAAELGDGQARAHLQAMAADPGESPCIRGHAATVLLDLGDGSYREQCLAFLRSGGALPDGTFDSRDAYGYRRERLVATVHLLRFYTAAHREALLPVLDVLDPVST